MAMNKQRRTSNINNVVAYDYTDSSIQLTGYPKNGVLKTTSGDGSVVVDSSEVNNGVINGGIVTWTGTGLVFNVSACTYVIDGNQYQTPLTQITLTPADATYDRIDVFVVNTSSQVAFVTGVPADDPIEPEGDTPTTLGLTNVTITAGSTTPYGLTRNIVYDENIAGEWTQVATLNNCSYDPIDSSQHYTGSVSMKVIEESPNNDFSIMFTSASKLDASQYKTLSFAVRLTSPWYNVSSSISISLYNDSKLVTNTFVIDKSNHVGFSMEITNQWQLVTIPLDDSYLQFKSNVFNKIRLRARIFDSFWIDTICLGDGLFTPSTTSSSKSFGFVNGSTGTAAATAPSDTLSIIGTGLAVTSATGKTLTINVPTPTSDGIVSGGVVTWSETGYQYNASPCVYIINGVQYSTISTNVTLDTSDATYDRIDIIAVNSSGQVVVIKGTASSNPQEPQVDPATQLQLTTVTVAASSSSPSGITTNMIYDENVETWTKLPVGFSSDFSNTVTPFRGTYCVLSTGTTSGTKYIEFSNSSVYLDKNNFTSFSFAIRLNQAFLSSESITVKFLNTGLSGGGVAASYSITSTNVVGFNRSNISSYQVITIPISAINFTNSNFDKIQIQIVSTRSSLISFRLDRIYLQGGIIQPTANYVSGTGTVNYVPKWATTKSLTNSLIFDNGTSVGIGTASPLSVNKLQVQGRIASNVSTTSPSSSIYSIIADTSVSYPASSSIGGSVVVNAVQGGTNYTFGGNATIPNSSITSSLIAVSGVGFSSTGTVTQNQAGSGIRSMANIFAMWTKNSDVSGTVTHMSNLRLVSFYTPYTGTTLTVNNYYAIVIESTNQFAGVSISNKWAIYQEGNTDNNYFAGKVLIGGTTVGSSRLNITGLPTSSAGLSSGDVWNDGGTLKIV